MTLFVSYLVIDYGWFGYLGTAFYVLLVEIRGYRCFQVPEYLQ